MTILVDGTVITVDAEPVGVTDVIVIPGPPGVTGPPGPSGGGGDTATAAENIPVYSVVALRSTGARKANTTVAANRWAACAIATSSATTGQTFTIKTSGSITDAAWAWVPDAPIYCTTTGALTQTAPVTGWLRVVAHAETTSRIFVQIHQPIQLA